LALFTSIVIVIAVYSTLQKGLWLSALIYTLMYLWLLAITFMSQITYWIRVSSLLILEFVGGVVGLLSSGLSGDGRSFLFALVISTTALLGTRRGALALIVSMVTFLIVGGGMSGGWIALPPTEVMINSGNGIDWTTGTLIFFLLGFLCLSVISYILDGLAKNIDRQKILSAQLREEQRTLEDRVNQRTSEVVQKGQELENEMIERKAAQESLAQMRSLLEIAFDQSSAGVLIADAPQFSISRFNATAEEILGLLPEEKIPNLSLRNYLPSWKCFNEQGELIPLEKMPLYRTMMLGEVVHSEREHILRADGSWRWVIINGSPVRDENGTIVGALIFFSDITASQHAEQALQYSEERYRKLVELSPDAIAVHQQGKLVFANPAGARLMRAQSVEQLIGLPLDQLVAPEYQTLVAERVRTALQSGKPLPLMEEEFVRLDGSRVMVEVASSPCTFNDQPAVQVFVRDITERLQNEKELRQSRQEIADAYEATLVGWARALELRERQTAGHSQRVVELAVDLARRMGMEEEKIPHLRRGALLHDIGKMAIPDYILLKPAALNEEEWTIMRMHPNYAVEMLTPIPYLVQALEIPQAHHEKWDGSGYPLSLKGEEIPLAARIFSVVDVWDALTSDRPYRLAWPENEALQYIRQRSGMQFDPQVTEIFLREIAPVLPSQNTLRGRRGQR
ncbi:MAG TPA: HD domain-containing phosphohydrolase, partial [Anaerolineaceae bacterium]|nr:HD domain-containing phosphohydrolase [Anaerolineaceae bacterium]